MKVLDVFSIKCDIMAVLCDNWRDNKTKFIAIKKGLYIKRGLNKIPFNVDFKSTKNSASQRGTARRTGIRMSIGYWLILLICIARCLSMLFEYNPLHIKNALYSVQI